MSPFIRRVTLARHPNRFVRPSRMQSTGSYQAPSPPPSQSPGSPHGAFYKTFGRPVIKNFLIAVLTYQAIYFTWAKLESIEMKKEKEGEMERLENELRSLTAGKRMLPVVLVMAILALFIISSERSKQPFRLFDLPQELRDRIYEYALYNERRDFWFFDRPPAWLLFPRTRNPDVALLRVSTQIRREATPVFWSRCHLDFVIRDGDRLAFNRFLACLRPATRRHLLRNPDVCVRVVFEKTCLAYRSLKENKLLGVVARNFGIVLELDIPAAKWMLTSEKAGAVDLHSMVKSADWFEGPHWIKVERLVFFRLLMALDRVSAEAAEALGLETLDPDEAIVEEP